MTETKESLSEGVRVKSECLITKPSLRSAIVSSNCVRKLSAEILFLMHIVCYVGARCLMFS
jgi:hypothetical protein